MTEELERKLARLMLYVGDVEKTKLRIAMESTLQEAHAQISDDKDSLYRYVDQDD